METIKKFIKSDLSTGILLIISTLIALLIANSPFKGVYNIVFHEIKLLDHFNLHMIVNDFFMAIFFLVVGIEIRKEILYGNLSSIKKASFPVIAALGGVIVPAIIFLFMNMNTEYSMGVGIPISTDIAFAIAIFMLMKNRLNTSLKVFLLSLAVVDDLVSIFAIGLLYSSHINYKFVILASIILMSILILNKVLKVDKLLPYIVLGLVLWVSVYESGIHATISGVLLAFVIPINNKHHNKSVADKIEHSLSPICNLIILPLFAFANTAINLNVNINLGEANTLIFGIIFGLVVGKPLGIILFTSIATKLGITEKPENASWISILKVAMLAGIGFTMSIFVSEIAFEGNQSLVDISKVSILLSSVVTIFISYIIIVVVPEISAKVSVFRKLKNALYHHK